MLAAFCPCLAALPLQAAADRSVDDAPPPAHARSAAMLNVDIAAWSDTDSANSAAHTLVTRTARLVRERSSFFPGFGLLRSAMKMCLACTCLAVMFKAMGKCNCCESKSFDVRRCGPIARFLRRIEYDEFEATTFFVKVHSVQDVVNKSVLGDKEFTVTVKFKWSKFETPPTKDLRWESAKSIEVPQGASVCRIQLKSPGMGGLRDSTIGELELETKKDMLDRGDDFFNKKQRLKMEKSGKAVATLNITFKQTGSGEGEDGGLLPIGGVHEDSALYQELLEAYEDYQKQPGFIPLKKDEKLEGERKNMLVSKCLAGQLREVDEKNKDKGQVYVTVRYCNFAELRGKDMEKEMVKQVEKARAQGLTQPKRKWYWVWYPDKAQAEHLHRWHFPDGFFPIVSITGINVDPKRIDQFIIRYANSEKKKDVLIYRRTGGKALDVWVDGLNLLKTDVKEAVVESRDKAAEEEAAMQRLRVLNRQFVAQNGLPKTPEGWKVWYTWLKDDHKYPDELIRKLKAEIDATASVGKGKAKGT